VEESSRRARLARHAVTGAILGAMCAIVAQVLGVQQLLRLYDVALFLPAALLGALIGITRLRPLLWIGAGLLALLSIAIGYTPLVRYLASPLIRRDALPARVDAIAALSMGVTPDGMMRSQTLDRVLSGLDLARRGLAPAIMVSREHRTLHGRAFSDSADLERIATMAAGSVAVSFVDSIFTTRTEALRMKSIAERNGWRTIAVVTSPLHTRRACATFEAVGFKVVCVPAAVRDSGLLPESDAEHRLQSFQWVLYETFATDSYRRRGWIR
jgi:uncharacterized SAM-binding protein YcdF (DUF218 family)